MGQLNLSQGKMKKGDDVVDDDNDDAVWNQSVTRLSDSNTVYCGIVPQYSVLHISDRTKCGGEDTDGQHDTLEVPAGFYTSQLVLHAINKVSGKSIQLFCDWGRWIKSIFLFPLIQLML
jgi:hypothetical protein